MKLTQVRGNTWVLDSWELIPLYKLDDHRCVLLDTGTVEQREDLLGELRHFITGQLPSWAEHGYLSQELSFKAQYGRSGSTTPVEDMVLLVSGMAPVMYSDGEGYVAMA